MRRKAMASWSLFCGIVGLLTASIHSQRPLHITDQKLVSEKTDTNENLQRAIEYIAREAAARLSEESGSNESLREILSFDPEQRDGGKDVTLPGRNLADDVVEDSGNSRFQMDSAGVKRSWGDASLQLWGKRDFEVMRGVGHSGNGTVQDTQGFIQQKLGAEGKQLLEEDKNLDELPDESSSPPDSNEDIPYPLGGTLQRPDSKSDEATKRKWGDNSMTVWGKRKAYGKRKWGDNAVTSWGKREDGSLEQAGKRKWGDNSMTVWGKRSSDDKRKWGDNSLTAWGKRQSDDKRKWGDNSMSIWGKRQADDKRKWGDNSLSAWGKRQGDDKRKWGDNSMSIWGKRLSDDKRKWGDNSMSIWGKREADDKRKWGDNSMSIWGERQTDDKRKWGDNSVSIWGKRQADDKRKWGDNSMTVWGKRQADDKRKWGDNSMSIWGKREDGAAQDQLAKRKWGDNSMTVWGKKRTDTASGPTEDQSKAALHAWLLQRLPADKMHPFRTGHEESLAGRSRAAALTGNILFAKDPVADTYQTTKPTSVASSTIDRLNSQVPSGQLRPPATGKDSEDTPPIRKSIAKRSVFGTPDVLSGVWPKRLRKRGWRFWGAYVNPYGGPKRNWETNTMKVWGKRRDEDGGNEAEEYTDWATTSAARDDGIWKRIWTSDNSLRIWGR